MSRIKTHVKVNDQVVVISGEHENESGKVLQELPKKQQVLIEGVRMIKKHAKKSQDRPDGGIIELEGPIHISNVKKIESKVPLLSYHKHNFKSRESQIIELLEKKS